MLIASTVGARSSRPVSTAAAKIASANPCQLVCPLAVEIGLLERAPTVEAISTSDYPTPAQRPAYSCLDTSALRERFGISLPDWREGVTQTLAELAGW